MRTKLRLLMLGLTLTGPGCTLISDATCLTAYTVRETAADFAESVRNRKWAESAWQEVLRVNPGVFYSEDHRRGFMDGFMNYVYRGGEGEPPPLPPPHYRKLRYQTPEGYRAIEDWFAGFRQGADVARQSGTRQWVTGPSALRVNDPSGPLPALPVEVPSLGRPVPIEPLSPPTATHSAGVRPPAEWSPSSAVTTLPPVGFSGSYGTGR